MTLPYRPHRNGSILSVSFFTSSNDLYSLLKYNRSYTLSMFVRHIVLRTFAQAKVMELKMDKPHQQKFLKKYFDGDSSKVKLTTYRFKDR